MSRSGEIQSLVQQTQAVKQAVADLCKAPSPQGQAKVQELMLPLKLSLIKFQLVPPFDKDGLTDQERQTVLTCSRETWESGVFLSTATKDVEAFWRYVTQARAFYFDLSHLVPGSDNAWVILGLNLMALLAHNRISEFHTLLERIPQPKRQRPFISFPIQLEQFLMEGAYNKILKCDELPHPSFTWFMSMLATTVRGKIMDCASKAYKCLSVQQAKDMFKLASDAELRAEAETRDWDIQGDLLCFKREQKQSLDIPAHKLIERQLDYASSLERIV